MDAFNKTKHRKGMKDLSTLQHFVGCDVSKDTLDFALYGRGVDYRSFQHVRVDNTMEGFQAMRKWLRGLGVVMSDAVIAMEHTGYYSVALSEWCARKKVTFVLLHPLDVKNACGCGRNKTDKADAQFIADYVYTMREKLSPSQPESPVTGRLRQLRNERQLAVRTRASFLTMARTLTDAGSLRRVRKTAEALTAQVKAIEDSILKVIESEAQVLKNYRLLTSITGIGLVNAVTTIVATGNFTRFQTARQYAKFSCVSPLRRESGTSVRGGDHVSKAGHSEIKATLTEGARSAIHHDRQLKAYYERKRAEGKSHGCVMNAVKFKMICRMFAVIKRQTPYVALDLFRGAPKYSSVGERRAARGRTTGPDERMPGNEPPSNVKNTDMK